MSKKPSKYFAAFDYTDKTLTVLSGAREGVSVISFATGIGVPVGIASVSFSLIFSLTTGIIKKLLNITSNKKKKHNNIVMLTKSKLHNIETLISQILIDLEINHEELKKIVKKSIKNEKRHYNDKKQR